ncbi:hypothetical protein V1509DRAFT_637105 [Lipomyces kononenkoae]
MLGEGGWFSMIHHRSNIDLHLGNALLRLPADFDKLSIDQLYRKYGVATSEPVVRLDGQPIDPSVPSNAATPIWLGKTSEEFSSSEVKVSVDMSRMSPSPLHRLKSALSLNGVFPSHLISGPSHVLLLGQRPLFEEFLATQDDVTAEQVDVLGKLPLEWWEKWDAGHQYFREMGEPNPDRHVRSWADRFEAHIQRPRREAGIPEFDAHEKAAVMDMLQSMLFFTPERRLTARDILNCDWMVKWALPAFENRTL